MSAYSFGKIITDDSKLLNEKIRQLASRSMVEVRLGFHEPEDKNILDQSVLLRGEGVVFNLFAPGQSDVISLCSEATEVGRKAMRTVLGDANLPISWDQVRGMALPEQVYEAVRETRLGGFVSGLFKIDEAKSAGFAIFDNGVDQVIEETAETCLSLILRSLLVSWDLGPNALFVWKRQELHHSQDERAGEFRVPSR